LAHLKGVEVHLITSEQKEKSFCYPISNRVKHYDLTINYDRSKSYFNLVNFKKVPKHIKRLKTKLNEIKPDVLIVCNYAFDFYFIPFISKGIKTIKEFHASRYYYIKALPKANFYSKFVYTVNNWIEQKYTHIVILNEDEKIYYKSNNIVVIPNAAISIKRSSAKVRDNIIIAAGRIAPVKQFDHLIKAWSLIAEKFPDWQVQIYGDGDDELTTLLKQLIQELKVSNIQLKGATSELTSKMQEASLYALTSATECFPMVLLESLACGLPIISYDCPNGPRNIISNGEDGVLVEHNNIEDFSKKLAKLIRDEQLRSTMVINTVKNVNRFEEQKVMSQWIQLFNKVKR
jgi:glycosyltransferase involved in cell wall biosynthesis